MNPFFLPPPRADGPSGLPGTPSGHPAKGQSSQDPHGTGRGPRREENLGTGHWKATGRFFWKFGWKILYKNLDLKGGVQGEPPLPGPCTPPLRSRFVYRIFHHNFPKNCPVAIQWPVDIVPALN